MNRTSEEPDSDEDSLFSITKRICNSISLCMVLSHFIDLISFYGFGAYTTLCQQAKLRLGVTHDWFSNLSRVCECSHLILTVRNFLFTHLVRLFRTWVRRT
jgi:hypothetical protein